jgi:hypothetical protein
MSLGDRGGEGDAAVAKGKISFATAVVETLPYGNVT